MSFSPNSEKADYVPQPYPQAYPQQRPTNALGVVGLVFSCLGFITCGLLSPIGFLLSMIGLLNQPRTAAVVGSVIGFLGSFWLVLFGYAIVGGFFFAKSALQEVQTVTAFGNAMSTVLELKRDNGRLPDASEGEELVRTTRDAWQERIMYTRSGDDTFVLHSAGPDREHGTDDDLRSDQDFSKLADSGLFSNGGPYRIEGGRLVVRDGDKSVEINLGGISENEDGDVQLDGGSLRVRDGEKKVDIEIPGIRSKE